MILRGRPVSSGRARGRVLATRRPVSFLGAVDPKSGRVLDPRSDIRSESLAGRVLAFPRGAGSTVGSYVLYGLAKRGRGPAALIADRAEAVVAVGAILGEIPMVDGVDTRALESGDLAVVNGNGGTVSVPAVEERAVVTAFLEHRNRILFVRRSRRVGSFRGRWSGISGYLEGSETPIRRARQEITEETGMRRVRLLAAGTPLWGRGGRVAYRIHPFLFAAPSRRVRLDWENVEARWLAPRAATTLPTVPRLGDALAAVLRARRTPSRGDRPRSRR